MPQPAFLVRAGGLSVVAGGAGAAALALVRVSTWLAPAALGLALVAALAAWGAVVQFLGGEKVDDHPWV
ncbi:MAG: hypothetical protein WD557_12050 [Dehalococcoidia bacterium]